MRIPQKIRSFFQPGKILYIMAGVFFVIYAFPYLVNGNIYNSPDENANFVFVKHFIQYNDLKIPFESNPENIIRPRSVNILNSDYVPGSFVGLIILFHAVSRQGKSTAGAFTHCPCGRAGPGDLPGYAGWGRAYCARHSVPLRVFLPADWKR